MWHFTLYVIVLKKSVSAIPVSNEKLFCSSSGPVTEEAIMILSFYQTKQATNSGNKN